MIPIPPFMANVWRVTAGIGPIWWTVEAQVPVLQVIAVARISFWIGGKTTSLVLMV